MDKSELSQSDKLSWQYRDQRSLIILKQMLLRHCKGNEYGFFFIPKRNAFQKLFELLNKYSSNIAIEISPIPSQAYTAVEDDDWNDELSDHYERIELIFCRIQRSIKDKLMLRLRGSVRIAMLNGKPLSSHPISYEKFRELIQWLKEPKAFDKKRVGEPACTNRKKPALIYFKMRARVPSE